MNRRNIIWLAILLMSCVVLVPAQTARERALEFYQTGNYKEAAPLLESVTKQNKQDAEALFYLGASLFRLDRIKEGEKVFKKLINLNPDNFHGYIGVAYANLFKNKLNNAKKNASKALEINPKSAEANYLLGEISFRVGSYDSAYQSAEKAIALEAGFAPPYLLKSEALTQSFAQTVGAVTKALKRVDLLKEAAESLEKYLELEKDKEVIEEQKLTLDSLKFFTNYYSQVKPAESDGAGWTPLEIVYKARPQYTEEARSAQVGGMVRLLVEFSDTGEVRHIMVAKGLSHGLTKRAIEAAKKIRFNPATKDGKPVSVAKFIEFNFALY